MARMVDDMARMLAGEVDQPAAARLIGMRLASYGDGEAVVVMEADDRHANPMGTVQGGLLAAAADAAMGWACMTLLPEGETYTTVEMKMNFLRPAWQGRLEARGRVKSAGRTIMLVECDVVSADGKLVAHAVSTCMTLRGEKAAGR
jgi:uncharacterized protein (TIGR00369 family)